MQVTVRHAKDIDPAEPLDASFDLAVVIDVIRAFTAAPWVLRQGATRLFLAPNVDTAAQIRETKFPTALLMKDGAPDPRFELPNAPGGIADLDLTGQTVIQTTGNGTRCAHLVRDVPVVACASFANATATVRLTQHYERVLLLPTEGDEDYALADFLQARAAGEAADVGSFMQRVAASEAGVECAQRGQDPSAPGVHPSDLELCMTLDTFPHALIARPHQKLLAVEIE